MISVNLCRLNFTKVQVIVILQRSRSWRRYFRSRQDEGLWHIPIHINTQWTRRYYIGIKSTKLPLIYSFRLYFNLIFRQKKPDNWLLLKEFYIFYFGPIVKIWRNCSIFLPRKKYRLVLDINTIFCLQVLAHYCIWE